METRVALALALAIVCALPGAAAHLVHDIPHVDATEATRTVEPVFEGTAARVDLLIQQDPLVDLVRHRVDPQNGTFAVEYRRDASSASSGFQATLTWTRFLEYKDNNADLRFENDTDSIVRSWPMSDYRWIDQPWHAVFIGGQTSQDTAWAGNASGAPQIKIELGAAGNAFSDEGAHARQQDIILYVDMKSFPPRGVGDLYALEGSVATTGGLVPSLFTFIDDTGAASPPVAVLAQATGRQATFDWGAQATLDDVEQNLTTTLGAPDAHGVRSFEMEFPRFDKTLHMVMVDGVEYSTPAARSPGVGLGVAVLGVAALALLRRAR